jgi:hypothetical protein
MFNWNKQQQAESADTKFTTKGIYGLEVCHDDDQAIAE